jgi:hypothetical protein
MIELQDERVGLSAIDARMRTQVLENPETVLDPITVHACDLARDVAVAVVQVVLPSIGRVAGAAVVLTHTSLDRAKGELGLWLLLMTHRAAAHGDTSVSAPTPTNRV